MYVYLLQYNVIPCIEDWGNGQSHTSTQIKLRNLCVIHQSISSWLPNWPLCSIRSFLQNSQRWARTTKASCSFAYCLCSYSGRSGFRNTFPMFIVHQRLACGLIWPARRSPNKSTLSYANSSSFRISIWTVPDSQPSNSARYLGTCRVEWVSA